MPLTLEVTSPAPDEIVLAVLSSEDSEGISLSPHLSTVARLHRAGVRALRSGIQGRFALGNTSRRAASAMATRARPTRRALAAQKLGDLLAYRRKSSSARHVIDLARNLRRPPHCIRLRFAVHRRTRARRESATAPWTTGRPMWSSLPARRRERDPTRGGYDNLARTFSPWPGT